MKIKRTAKTLLEGGIPQDLEEFDNIEIQNEPDRNGKNKQVYLNTLRGCPKKITGKLDIENAPVKSFRGGPKEVDILNISGTDITSLQYMPSIAKTLLMSNTDIESLKYITSVNSLTANNSKLKSLKYCPENITIDIDKCSGITSLADGPKTAKIYSVSNCQIETLADIDTITCKWLDIESNPIRNLDGFERVFASKFISISITTYFTGLVLTAKFCKSKLQIIEKENWENKAYESNEIAREAFRHLDKSLFRAKLAMVQAGAKQYAKLR